MSFVISCSQKSLFQNSEVKVSIAFQTTASCEINLTYFIRLAFRKSAFPAYIYNRTDRSLN